MNKMNLIMYLDDGHGQNTPGKRTPVMPCGVASGRSIHENEFNKNVVEKLTKLAIENGFEVVLVAEGDTDVPLHVRSEIANGHYKSKALSRDEAIFISVHANAYDGKFGTNKGGVETYYYPGSKEGEKLAHLIQRELIKGISQIDRGVKSANFHVLRETLMPAVLVEALFMDVLDEAVLMLDDEFQDEVANEIMTGINQYFGRSSVNPSLETMENKVIKLEEKLSLLNKLLMDGLKILGGDDEKLDN